METKNNQIARLLWGAREAREEARRHHLRVQELEARCTAMTARMNGMPQGGGDRHSLEQAILLLSEERELELESLRTETARYHQIEALIDQASRREYRAVLRLRYLRGLGWTAIQQEMAREGLYYSDRHLYRLHEDALRELRRAAREGGEPHGVQAEAAPELLHRPADTAGEAEEPGPVP